VVAACNDPLSVPQQKSLVPQKVDATTGITATLVGTYDVSYYANAGGCFPPDRNPYNCVYVSPGPIHVAAQPGTYRVDLVSGVGLPGNPHVWDGDASGGTVYFLNGETPSVTFNHSAGEITLYHYDWVPWDNDPSAVWVIALYRLTDAVNRPPALTLGGPYTTPEGSVVALGWSSSDPDGDALTYTWDFGNGVTGSGPTLPTSYTYPDNPNPGTAFTITVTADDGKGGTATQTTTATVGNVTPTITGATIPSAVTLASGGAATTISGVTYTDPGAADGPFTTAIQCGDGTMATAAGQCTYTTVGTYTVSVTVSDKDGGVSQPFTGTVRVAYPWTGFFQPVDNPNVLNVVKAGSAIPVKFSLGGNYGLSILAAGYPVSAATPCTISSVSDDIEQTVTAGGSSLSYDPATGQYIYVWKTDKTWTGCRRLVVQLVDGTSHIAYFQFR
jgi:hypothetical protein